MTRTARSRPPTAPTGGSDGTQVALELRGITKDYGKVPAVRGIDLDIHAGEVVTLLGPSGCGKTTTLRIVMGLESLTSGSVVANGRVLDGEGSESFVPVHKRRMGMVFQSYAIWPHMTVAQNVGYPLKVRKVAREQINEAVERSLQLVGLNGLAERSATQLSGGQSQRVALARALISEPEVLLLDEPFSNLDARLREEMVAEVKLLQRRLGITVLFVTHDQQEAFSLSDRIAVMSDGRIEQVSTPEELYAHPKTRMVRDFMGKCVRLDGTVVSSTDSDVVVDVSVGNDTNARIRSIGRPREGIDVGGPCELSIRYEQIKLGTAELASTENSIIGTLRTLLFRGDRYEARVDLGTGKEVVLQIQDTAGWREGEAIRLVFPPDHVLVWEK